MNLAQGEPSTTTLCDRCDHRFEHAQYNLDSAMISFRLNYSPDFVEANLILQTVDVIDSHLAQYEPEIARVQAILASLQQEQANLMRFRECCSSILSPVRKLPPEILQTVFVACVGPQPDVVPIVGQVCAYWREVALDTPRLWSNISVGRTRFTSAQHYLHLASLFLERSANHLLTISLRHPVSDELLALVRRSSNRWATLRICSTTREFYDSLGLDYVLPMLKKLEIVDTATDTAAGSQNSYTVQAPSLQEVVLKNRPGFWGLPWAQLTRLQYDVPVASDAIAILRQCPQLVECSLDKLKVPSLTELLPVGRSQTLRRLRLAVDTVGHLPSAELILNTFFTSLTLPSLTSLEIIGQWTAEDLIEFLTRSECELENLTLGTGYMKPDRILTLFESLPLLKTLVLDADLGTSRQLPNRVVTDKLLRRLILYPDSDAALPRLTHLTLRTAVNFEDQVLIDMIESRWIPWTTVLYGVPVARLTSLDLVFCGRKETLEPATIEGFRELFEAGLQISLQQGREKISLMPSVTPDVQ